MARQVKDMNRRQQQAAMANMGPGGAGTKPIDGGGNVGIEHSHMWNEEVAERKRIGGFLYLKKVETGYENERDKWKKYHEKKGKLVIVEKYGELWELWVSLHDKKNLERYPNVYKM